MRHQCFAVCAPGLERFVSEELVGLGIRRAHLQTGGVTFDATTRELYAANVWCRTATRVLVRVARFRARDFTQLQNGVASVDWDDWLPADRAVHLRVSSTRSRLYHTGAIEERVRRVLDRDESSADDAQLLVVRAVDDVVTISADASGAPLYKRGWRTNAGKAPLRESLAAAMILATSWRGEQPLVDPFCGSGTIAIEAATMATGRAPGSRREFAFQRWPSFQPGTFASVRATMHGHDESRGRIIARDRDAGAVETTLANAERAGLSDRIEVQRATISELGEIDVGESGWIITNPPYGKRVSSRDDLRDLFARFGDVARHAFPGWHVGLLVADGRPAGHARLPVHEQFQTRNGGIPVSFVTGRVSPRLGP
jgi:putative N6-adenine-specific DNA methylase